MVILVGLADIFLVYFVLNFVFVVSVSYMVVVGVLQELEK